MKIILGFALLLITTIGLSQVEKKVLFIGNSYTSSNNLPGLISSLANSDGNALSIDAHTPGGAQLNAHAVNPTVLNKIAVDNWDFVVIQEQSQKPSFPDAQVESDVYPYAEILVDSIYSNTECGIPLFYNTWGKQHGETMWEGISTFEKMNSRLFNAYTQMANESVGMLSPVGVGFAHIKQDDNAIVDFNQLYTSDGSHPSIKGSYLAACVFNNIIFEVVSSGNTFLPIGLTVGEAEYLQGVADHVVYEVDSVQTDFRPSLGENDFITTVNGGTVTFTPTILGGSFGSWDFGEGNTSVQESVSHTYLNNGIYEVTLFTKARCKIDSVKHEITISTLSLLDEDLLSFNVYPNPSMNGELTIEVNGDSYRVYTLLGEEIYFGVKQQLTLLKGVYIVRYKNESRKITVF